MQAEQIDSIVVAVRSADDGMNVKFRRLVVGQKDAGMMVEFDKRHRALNPVIELAVLFRREGALQRRGAVHEAAPEAV